MIAQLFIVNFILIKYKLIVFIQPLKLRTLLIILNLIQMKKHV